MKAQFVVISAYMAVVLIITALTVIYVVILPHSQTYLSSYNNLEKIRNIVYSRVKWTAESLAREIYSQLNVKYVYVNITSYNISSNKLVSIDYYIIRPTSNEPLSYVVYNFTTIDPQGIIYIYNIKVGIWKANSQ